MKETIWTLKFSRNKNLQLVRDLKLDREPIGCFEVWANCLVVMIR